jgi:ABC-2 type transport system ATP-binding protein
VITLESVTQHYGVRPILRDINLHIESGELVAIIGPNGMGKSTLLGAMAGALQPQRGFVEINGLRRRSSVEAELKIRRQTVYLPDHPWLPANRTGREYLLAVGRLYDIESNRLVEHVERLLTLFELDNVGDSPTRTYSAGQQKKIALCSALVTEASVMLLDEPFSGGLDPSGILALKRVLQRLAESQQATIVMTTPVPELVEELADRIVILHDGRVAAFGTLDDLRQTAECSGSLGDVLEKLICPDTFENLQHYFEGRNA